MTPWLCWQVLTGILFSSLRLLFEGEEGGLIMLGNRHDFRWEDVLKPGYCRKHPLNISCFDLDSFLWLSLLLFCLSSFLPLFFSASLLFCLSSFLSSLLCFFAFFSSSIPLLFFPCFSLLFECFNGTVGLCLYFFVWASSMPYPDPGSPWAKNKGTATYWNNETMEHDSPKNRTCMWLNLLGSLIFT